MSIYDDNSADNTVNNGQNYTELLGQLETNLVSDKGGDHGSLSLASGQENNALGGLELSAANSYSDDDYMSGEEADADQTVEAVEAAEAAQQNAVNSRSTARLVKPGSLVVFLLKNYIDREDDKILFESLIRQEREVEEFCRRLFLRLVVDQDAGYAYVRSLTDEELPTDAGQRPPQLLSKRPLPFYESFMLIILRQRLLEFDMSGQFGRLVLERSEIITLVKTFVHNIANEKRLDDNLNKAIDNLCSLGLLSKNNSGNSSRKENKLLDRIEIKRIISVIVTPEILKQADDLLDSYVKHIQDGGRSKNRLTSDDESAYDLGSLED